jgi:hypothetical protein
MSVKSASPMPKPPVVDNRYQRAEIDQYVKSLPADAPIRSIVASPAVQGRLTAFEKADDAALIAQARYRTWGRRGLWATTFGVLVGAFLLFPIGPLSSGTPRIVIGAIQTITILITVGATLIITWLKPLDQWMAYRAEAEDGRGKIFDAILNGKGPANGDAKLLAKQKLDLLMAAHINDQLRFFTKRAREHKKVASDFSPLRLIGYFIILCAGGIGLAALVNGLGIALPGALRTFVDWVAVPEANRWQLGLTTIASGILAHAAARTYLEEDQRKAALYTVTASKLKKIIERELPKAQAAIESGNDEALRKFYLDTRTIMEQEHAVWSFIRSADDAPAAS